MKTVNSVGRAGSHFLSRTPEYKSWSAMHDRCSNPGLHNYSRYGGRGITVCDRWSTVENFYEDMGPKPTLGHMLERRDNDQGYSPENCYWATAKVQARNRHTNRLLTHESVTLAAAEWAERAGISYKTLHTRLSRGWTVERALSEPTKSKHASKGR